MFNKYRELKLNPKYLKFKNFLLFLFLTINSIFLTVSIDEHKLYKSIFGYLIPISIPFYTIIMIYTFLDLINSPLKQKIDNFTDSKVEKNTVKSISLKKAAASGNDIQKLFGLLFGLILIVLFICGSFAVVSWLNLPAWVWIVIILGML